MKSSGTQLSRHPRSAIAVCVERPWRLRGQHLHVSLLVLITTLLLLFFYFLGFFLLLFCFVFVFVFSEEIISFHQENTPI